MHTSDSIIVTGKTRAQVSRDFKRIYGHDKVDEVKPISGRAVESRYGFEYKQIVKANTMVNTPEGNDPYINEQSLMSVEDYGFYEVSFIGTDEKDIVVGASLEDVKSDMEELYGENLDTVKPVQGDELASEDPTDPVMNHGRNVSILTGRNPFAESSGEWKSDSGWKKPEAERKDQYGNTIKTKNAAKSLAKQAVSITKRKDQLKNKIKEMKDIVGKAVTEDSLDEVGMPVKKTAAMTTGTMRLAKKKAGRAGRYEAFGTVITSDMDLEEQERLLDLLPSNLLPEAMEALGLEEKRGLWDNIHAKRKRIKAGSGERMRKPGSKGAPSNKDLKDSQKEEVEIDSKTIKVDHTAVMDKENAGYVLVQNRECVARGTKEEMLKLHEQTPKSRVWVSTALPGQIVESEEAEEKKTEIDEGQDKLMYLARIGLMNKNELVLLRRAMAQKSSGAAMSIATRNILFKLLDKMVGMVTGQRHMYNRAKVAAMREAMDDVFGVLRDREMIEHWNENIDRLEEAGYMDPPKTKAEVKKKFPDIETDVKNKDSIETQSVKYK